MSEQKLIEYLDGFLSENKSKLFKDKLAQRTRHITVALQDLFQEQNASAVIRTCEIFGIQDVYTIEERNDFKPINEIARGAQKWLDQYAFDDPEKDNTLECIDHLRDKGYQIIATSPHKESCFLEDFDFSKKSAIFFGSEKPGLSQKVFDNADGFLKVPMYGFTESLNISVSCGIILHHLTRELRKSDVDWQLSQEEQNELFVEWCRRHLLKGDEIIAYFLKQQEVE